jgi:hypothetical protein
MDRRMSSKCRSATIANVTEPAIWDAPVVISGRVFWDGWVRRDLVLPKLGRSA